MSSAAPCAGLVWRCCTQLMLGLPSLPTHPQPGLQVKKAFSQRRKVARNSLRPLWEPADVAVALRAAGLNEDARAQDLTLAEFGALAWALQRQAGGAAGGGGEDEEAGSDGENL